jgi:hypothetical protein
MSENATWIAPIIAHPKTSGTFYVARQKVYTSTNNGGNWTAVSPNINGTSAVREMAISQSDPNIMFATSGSNVFKSTDAGATWVNVTTGLPGRTITSVSIYPTNPNDVFLTYSGFGTDKVYKSTNGGNTWVSISGNLPDTPVNDIFIYPNNPGNPNTFFVATDIGIFLSENDGANWFEITTDMPNTVVMHLDFSTGNQMLRAGTHGRGVFEAFVDFIMPVDLISFVANETDKKVVLNWKTATEINNSHFEVERKLKNQEWEKLGIVAGSGTITEFKNYFYEDDFSSLPYNGTVLYRLKQVDFNGTFEYSEIIAIDVKYNPTQILISQNFPNPFNPNTVINYQLPAASIVILKIFDILGNEIETLVNEEQPAGVYEINWDAASIAGGMPNGVYFYRIQAGSFVETKKMLYLK